MVDFSSTESSKAPKHTVHESAQGIRLSPGPFIGIVKNNIDPMRAGRLQIFIPELGGDPEDQSCWRTVAYASPFFGVTPLLDGTGKQIPRTTSSQSFDTNPHSYGFWMTPPDVGVSVICTFINGDPFKGYWFACIPDWPNMHMVPAIAGEKGVTNVVEYADSPQKDIGTIDQFYNRQSVTHDVVAGQLRNQGLDKDKDRGPITSTVFRESPSNVFGFSTPGRSFAYPANVVGSENFNEAKGNTATARRGGHSIVMDDGDIDGNNQLLRIRSAGGHQIMMNDNAGFMYFISSTGKAWFEIDQAGNINFYAGGQFNVKADGPIQLDGKSVSIHGQSVDILGDQATKVTGGQGLDLNGGQSAKLSGGQSLDLKGATTNVSGDKCVNVKGGAGVSINAGCVTINSGGGGSAQTAGKATPPKGMPSREPWSGHLKGQQGGSGTGSSGRSTAGSIPSLGQGSYSSAGGYGGIASGGYPSNSRAGFSGPISTPGPGYSGFNTGATDANSITGTTSIAALQNNVAFQQQLQNFQQTFPQVPNATTQLYSMMAGESSFRSDPSTINGQYSGYFQLGKNVYQPMGLTAQQFAALPADQQLAAYTDKLSRENFSGTNLGLYNAAGSNPWQNQPDSTVVYPAGSAEANSNYNTWVKSSEALGGPQGAATVGGIKAYYARNDAAVNAQIQANPATGQSFNQQELPDANSTGGYTVPGEIDPLPTSPITGAFNSNPVTGVYGFTGNAVYNPLGGTAFGGLPNYYQIGSGVLINSTGATGNADAFAYKTPTVAANDPNAYNAAYDAALNGKLSSFKETNSDAYNALTPEQQQQLTTTNSDTIDWATTTNQTRDVNYGAPSVFDTGTTPYSGPGSSVPDSSNVPASTTTDAVPYQPNVVYDPMGNPAVPGMGPPEPVQPPQGPVGVIYDPMGNVAVPGVAPGLDGNAAPAAPDTGGGGGSSIAPSDSLGGAAMGKPQASMGGAC